MVCTSFFFQACFNSISNFVSCLNSLVGIPFQLKDTHLTAVSGEKDPDLSELFNSYLTRNEIAAFLKQPVGPSHWGAQHQITLLTCCDP